MKKRVFEFLLITFGWVFTVSFCVAIQLSGKSNVLVALMVASLANVCFYTVLFLLHRYEQKERIREIVYGDLPLIVTIHETKSDTLTLPMPKGRGFSVQPPLPAPARSYTVSTSV